jgi:hypothetical protein
MTKLAFDTLSQAVDQLTKMGYNKDFKLKSDCVYCVADDVTLSPQDFRIDHTFRFEGMTNPSDTSIVYAISSVDGEIKGTVVDAYGVDSDPMTTEMLKKLQTGAGYSAK